MQIGPEKVVGVTYSLSVYETDPQTKRFVESTDEKNPLYFLYGYGNLLPDFEEQLLDKKVGDSFDFILTPEQGYGEIDPESVVALPMEIFTPDGQPLDTEMVVVGNRIPMSDNQGNQYMAKVVSITPENVTVDFNQELAGLHLHFTGTVVEVREAEVEELTHGHVHGAHGHQH